MTFNCSCVIPISSQLKIGQDTIIDGDNLVTLDGQGLTRLIQVHAGTEVELRLNSFFCLGERGGGLRYVSFPNGCLRGEQRRIQSADGRYLFCVGERSGAMRYLICGNCLRGESQLILPRIAPFTVFVGERSWTVRYVADAAACNPRGELPYVIVNPAG